MADFALTLTKARFNDSKKEWESGVVSFPQVDKIEEVFDGSSEKKTMAIIRFQSGEEEYYVIEAGRLAKAIDDRKARIYPENEQS